jgi:hypothetical protein
MLDAATKLQTKVMDQMHDFETSHRDENERSAVLKKQKKRYTATYRSLGKIIKEYKDHLIALQGKPVGGRKARHQPLMHEKDLELWHGEVVAPAGNTVISRFLTKVSSAITGKNAQEKSDDQQERDDDPSTKLA